MSAQAQWEPVTTWRHEGHDYTTLRRLRVPGGWLYETRAYNVTRSLYGPDDVRVASTSAAFVPDVAS